LSIIHQTAYGNGVYIYGNIPKLGNRDISKVLRLECKNYDYWVLNTYIKSFENDNRLIEYKFIVCDWDDPTKIHYKEDVYRCFSMTNIGFQQKLPMIINDKWQKFLFKLQLPLT